jgi:imidazolonepropionase
MTSPPTSIACTTLVTCAFGKLPARGGKPEVVRDGVVTWDGGKITYAGPRAGFEGEIHETYPSSTVVPGFVDCHTHLPFMGWRDDEFEARLRGVSYRDLQTDGGIPRSARMLNSATDEEVLDFCRPLLAEMLRHGTTTLEMKTGYGLSIDSELRQARLARRLAAEAPLNVVVTLLPCHAVPHGRTREQWVQMVCDELIPRAAYEGLVDAVDVYVEDIAFSLDDLRRVAAVAEEVGLPLRCHADQLGDSGATEVATRLGARSVDHLNHASAAGVNALAEAETVGVLLPASTLMLREPLPPAGPLVEAGAAISIATDFNPGTSPVLSMPETIALACSLYGLPPHAALIAATANPSWVLGRHHDVGTLEPGKRADLLVLEGEDFRMVPYRPGHNPIRAVYVGGIRVDGS